MNLEHVYKLDADPNHLYKPDYDRYFPDGDFNNTMLNTSDMIVNSMSPITSWLGTIINKTLGVPSYGYKKVIFNKPATIVLWTDGTKTVVKCQPGDIWDPEKGLALCFMKKFLGNKGRYYDILKKEIQSENE